MRKTHNWLLAALLAGTMLLTGCGEKQVSGNVTPGGTQAAAVPAGTVTPTEATEREVSLGRIEGGVYTNAYAGFGCSLDSNWEFYSAEELQELPENVQELFADTELGDAAGELTQLTDMKAENVNDLTTINVLYTKLDAQSRLAYAMMREEEILDAVLEQKDAMISAYAQAGIEVDSIEKVEVDFLGEKHFAIRTSATWDGVPYYTLQVFDYHAGRYGVTTTLASYLEDNTESLLSLFYKVS